MPDKRRRERSEVPGDIEVGAVLRAKKLRFDKKPETTVEFPGSAPSSGSHTERKNLPDEVEPGVTYRDVEVRWKARADVEARILLDEDGRPIEPEGPDRG